MEKVPYIFSFKVGCFYIDACGDGDIVIIVNKLDISDVCHGKDALKNIQEIYFQANELNEISDKAYAHKIAYENYVHSNEEQENAEIVDVLENIEYG